MKLSKETGSIVRKEVESILLKDIKEGASVYQSNGLTFKRFIWDCYHALGHAKQTEIIADRNNIPVVGGYMDLKDSHIETMLKHAFSDLAW